MLIRLARIEDAAGIAKVHVDSWRTTYRGMVPEDYLANLSYEAREKNWMRHLEHDGAFIYVAENASGHIIGFVAGGAPREADPFYKGELYAIYLLQAPH